MKTETHDPLQDAEYEAVAAKLRTKGVHVPPKGSWMKRIGSMKDSHHFDEAIRLGAAWREQVNQQSLAELNADS